jgi:hypothetical protein
MRPTLGDLNSIVCFKAVVTGMEQALGERTAAVGLIAAGRIRGANLVTSLGLAGSGGGDPQAIRDALDGALGVNGTRLCLVDKVELEDGTYRVYLGETVCSAGEPPGSPRNCTFTLGAIQGALEALSGRKLRGRQIGSSLRGSTHDIIEYGDRL